MEDGIFDFNERNIDEFLSDVLDEAISLSEKNKHCFLGVEHVFCALVGKEGSIVSELLKNFAVEPSGAIREIMKEAFFPGEIAGSRQWQGIPATPRLNGVLRSASEMAVDKTGIDEVCLLLSIFKEGNSIPVRWLRQQGLYNDAIMDIFRTCDFWKNLSCNYFAEMLSIFNENRNKEEQYFKETEEKLNTEIIGQSDAVKSIVKFFRGKSPAGSDEGKLSGVLLFVGPDGTGKTFAAGKIAEYLFKDKNLLIKFDMKYYREECDKNRLLGNESGDTVIEKEGELPREIIGNSHRIILMKGIEKSHPEILRTISLSLSRGFFVNGIGMKIPCGNILFILTTSASEPEAFLDEDFTTQINKIIKFRNLGPEELKTICGNTLDKLKAKMKEEGINLLINQEVAAWISDMALMENIRTAKVINRIIREKILKEIYASSAVTKTFKVKTDHRKNLVVRMVHNKC